MKSLKNMPESLETMTDSVQLRPLFWKFVITGRSWGLFVDKHKRAFSLVETWRDQLALSLNLGIFQTGNISLGDFCISRNVRTHSLPVL